ncbi:hypothetical protein [Paenibacillus sanguinis]|uniref:hypothetical protein n=1 Tax=Paenibacillus sanguinis TaxID=225906 RepID=UPI000363B44D|nr:hypothetical protein [Paenibacillus sanguinis]
MEKFKNIEDFLKKKYNIRLLSWRSSLNKQHEMKEDLKKRDLNELRTLKSDANALSEWYKSISYVFSVLSLIISLFISIVTTSNQNQLNFNNAIIDDIAQLRLKGIEEEWNVSKTKKSQGEEIILKTAELKGEEILRNFREITILFLSFMILMVFISIVILYTSRKYFSINNLINEVIEEKKEEQNDLMGKSINEEKERVKLRNDYEKVRKERLDQKYNK